MNENETLTKTKIIKPDLYSVEMINDEYTTMDFVIELLMHVFNKNIHEARAIAELIHHNGSAIVGEYVLNIAQLKVNFCLKLARENSFPLVVKIKGMN